MNMKRARRSRLTIVDIPHANKQGSNVFERHLIAHGKRCTRPKARASRRHTAHKRTSACYHYPRFSLSQRRKRLAPSSDDRIIRGNISPWQITTLGIAHYHIQAQPCGKRSCCSISGFLTAYHKQTRTWIARPKCCEHEWTSALRNRKRYVFTRI